MEIKEAGTKTISDLSEYFFVVPDYQREYVWEPDTHVDRFIIDIENEFDAQKESQENYFIGSIIILKNKNGKYEVIDGQQRLTTIVLAICAFRDLLIENEADLNEDQKNNLNHLKSFLYHFDIKTQKKQFRLELQYPESKNFLECLILNRNFKEEKTSSIRKMRLAYENLNKHFASYLKAGIDVLVRYTIFYLTNIEIVVIRPEDLGSALKIFETINQRGAGLNAMDLVKNLLFSKTDETNFPDIKNIWKEIIKNLESCQEDQNPLRFLRYFIMSRYHNGILREDDLYNWIISTEGKEVTKYDKDPVGFASELNHISKRYANLVKATERMKWGEDYNNVTNIGFINRYKSRQHLILLLALHEQTEAHVVDYLAQQIESFFFFSNTIGIQAKSNEQNFSKWAKGLRGAKTVDEVRQIINKTIKPFLEEKVQQFKHKFKDLYHYDYNPQYRIKYVLGRLENTIRQKSNLPVSSIEHFQSYQLEHILPQTAHNHHQTTDYLNIDEYNDHVYLMGNVTLLESQYNQVINNCNDLSTDWFDRKQEYYDKSDIIMTRLMNDAYSVGKDTASNRLKSDIAHVFETWNYKDITKRQEILMDLALETWKIDGKRLDTHG